MKLQKILSVIAALALIITLCDCGKQSGQGKSSNSGTEQSVAPQASQEPTQLPARYQSGGYSFSKDAVDDDLGLSAAKGGQLRVGATIKSTVGPQPLWDVLKRLANLKGMTVSWASDVDQNYLVDVDINSQDLFQEAVGNLLRQADYFYEINGRNIVVKNKTTKVFHVGVPYIKGDYTSNVGGNFMTTKGDDRSLEGTIKINSQKNPFDIWANIQKNLDVILDVAAADREAQIESRERAAQEAADAALQAQGGTPPPAVAAQQERRRQLSQERIERIRANKENESAQRASDGGFYIIDKATGSVTVTAKPSTMATIEKYFDNLKKELFRQISIEAKIIEVYLSDYSKIGIDWQTVFQGLEMTGAVLFGADNAITDSGYKITQQGLRSTAGTVSDITYSVGGRTIQAGHTGQRGEVYPYRGKFVQRVLMDNLDFTSVIHALESQGNSRVLSSPRITVLNGQPALISVGKVMTYVSEIEIEKDNNTLTGSDISIDVDTDTVTDGISMGVIGTIVDDNTMILQLTPVTSELTTVVNAETGLEDVPYRSISVAGAGDTESIGMPIINMREMSTTVQVHDGELLVIGGLIDEVENNTSKYPPLLGKIPLVKYLFGYEEKTKSKRELVILLAPKIL